MRLNFSLLVLVLGILGFERASAQFEGPGWGIVVNQIGLYNAMGTLERNHETIFGKSPEKALSQPSRAQVAPGYATQGLSGKSGSVADTRFAAAPAAHSTVAEMMAEAYPATHRDQAKKVFIEMLAGYRKIERQFNLPANDLAGAVAAFIAGSYMAYRNQDFPDQDFIPLVNQMRAIIRQNPAFTQASAAEKRETYEQLATLGMLMAGTQMAVKASPNPQVEANMRRASKAYLEEFLKVEADRVLIGPRGLTLR